MEELDDNKKPLVSDNNYIRTYQAARSVNPVRPEEKEISYIITSEGGETLFNYADWLGVINEPNVIVLSSQHHFYYEKEDLRNTSVIISTKQLNHINNLEEFFNTIFNLLPPGSKFVGCFAENGRFRNTRFTENEKTEGPISRKEAEENGILSKNPFINMILSLIDLRTNRYITKQGVEELFTVCGFTILDMTELNGLTYLCVQKKR